MPPLMERRWADVEVIENVSLVITRRILDLAYLDELGWQVSTTVLIQQVSKDLVL